MYLFIFAIKFWLEHASLTQIIRNETGDPNANVTVKEVIIYMVLSLLAVYTAEELIKKLKK